MAEFLRTNRPWRDLVDDGHAQLQLLAPGRPLELSPALRVTPLAMPHRSEISETFGFLIEFDRSSVLYAPDTDRLEAWDEPVESWLERVDRVVLDGTFFDLDELKDRDIRTVPHPTIRVSMRRLGQLPLETRSKVWFTHLNHTNPAIHDGSEAHRAILELGFRVARDGDAVGGRVNGPPRGA
jgi:pyrroloquinoline quinone biosynthesis protein B